MHISPAERALLVELDGRGVGGMDYLELKRRRTVDIAERLVEKGYLTATAHGRVVSPSAVTEFKKELHTILSNAGELHHREVARIFGLSRGAVRDLLALLVAEGVLIERGPTVVALSERGYTNGTAT
jgi:predicted transcriptional regulator of viral defense system